MFDTLIAPLRRLDGNLSAASSTCCFCSSRAQFSASNRPVLTSRVHQDSGFANFHIETLGAHRHNRELLYQDQVSAKRLLAISHAPPLRLS